MLQLSTRRCIYYTPRIISVCNRLHPSHLVSQSSQHRNLHLNRWIFADSSATPNANKPTSPSTTPPTNPSSDDDADADVDDPPDDIDPPPSPIEGGSVEEPERLTIAAAKRILAPHLYPLSTTSPWQQAKEDMKARSEGESKSGAQTSVAHAVLRRPYAFLNRLAHHWLDRLAHLLEYGRSSEGNIVDIYHDGDLAFEAMFEAIDAAKQRVCLETYVWKADRVGLRTIQALEAAADRGCQVLVLYDNYGSFLFNSAHLSKLAAHPNAHVVAFNPVISAAFFRAANKDWASRTHRKILIADGIAFAGGMNTSEEYAGNRLGIGRFRDTHMRVIGPGVEHLAEVFFQSLQEAHAHDRATWKRIFRNIRARAGIRITQSDLFNSVLETLAASAKKGGVRKAALEYFEQTKERQQQRMEAVNQTEKELQADVEKKEAATLLGSDQPPTGSTDKYALKPKQKRRSARENMAAFGRFVSDRFNKLGQASATPQTWNRIKQLEYSAKRQWRMAWKAIRKQRSEKKNGNDHPQQTPTTQPASQQPLSQSPMAALASSLTTSPFPSPRTPVKSTTMTNSTPTTTENVDDATAAAKTDASFKNVFLQVYPSNSLREQYSIQHALIDVLDNGMDYILVTNPFLAPPLGIKNALINAGKRGVTVRIIVGGKSDTPYMRWSSSHIYHEFLAYPSISIYEYQPKILHAKTLTIDGLYTTIGSFNLDFLSSHKLLEVNIGMLSPAIARSMEQQHDRDIKDCIQITKESLKQRSAPEKLLHWLAYHISRTFYSLIQ